MEVRFRSRLCLYTLAMWLQTAARALLWCLMTGCVAMGTAWAGRPAVLTEWLAAGPPAWLGPDRKQVAIALEAARGVAAMEYWMRAGCPPPTDGPGRRRTARPDASG